MSRASAQSPGAVDTRATEEPRRIRREDLSASWGAPLSPADLIEAARPSRAAGDLTATSVRPQVSAR
jgi:hypothetical protein